MEDKQNSRSLSMAALGCVFLSLSGLAYSSPQVDARQLPGRMVSPYAPVAVKCPSEELLRSSREVAPVEKQWAKQRKVKADKALKKYLQKTGDFPELSEYPMLALANSGGGVRGFLTSAGMRMAYDEREGNNYTTSGLLQAFTYESGLSGSSIMLGSYVMNNNEKTLDLYDKLWKGALENGLFTPGGPTGSAPAYAGITKDIIAKAAVGVPVSGSDAFSRLFAYTAFFNSKAGPAGVAKHLSGALDLSNYKNHNAPLPIFVTLGLESATEGCGLPPLNATQYEFTPFEFGSFDRQVKAFIKQEYLGSSLDNGKPKKQSLTEPACVTGFDNAAFVIGTSTAIHNQNCGEFGGQQINNIFNNASLQIAKAIVDPILGDSQIPFFSIIPNFAYNNAPSTKTKNLKTLYFVDGGENVQVIPDFPYIYRPEVKVLYMSDSSTFGLGSKRIYLPNGRSLYNSAKQAKNQGKGHRFPEIPNPDKFYRLGLSKRPTFFGCNSAPDGPEMTILYMPNAEYTYDSAIITTKNKYNSSASAGVLFNGAAVGTYNNKKDFGFCLACATMKRQSELEGKTLPSGCKKCFKDYCYN